jgi:hypothetical protein
MLSESRNFIKLIKYYLVPIFLLMLQFCGIWQNLGAYPNLILAFIYYVSVYESVKFFALYYLLLGFFNDALSANLNANTGFIWILFHLIVRSQKKYLRHNDFKLCWLSFSLFSVFYFFVEWLYRSQYEERLIYNKNSLISSLLLTILIYPMVSKIFSQNNTAYAK